MEVSIPAACSAAASFQGPLPRRRRIFQFDRNVV
jgi:hypothetical protein